MIRLQANHLRAFGTCMRTASRRVRPYRESGSRTRVNPLTHASTSRRLQRQIPVGWVLAALLIGLPAATAALAGGAQSLAAIEQVAQTAARERATADYPRATRIDVQVQPLDERLNLARCGAPLETFPGPGARAIGRTTIGVRCTQPHRWQLYVRIRVGALIPVLVSSRLLERGERITRDDVRIEPRDAARLRRPALENPAKALGQIAGRRVPRGRVIHPGMLDQPHSVQRGQRVSILSADGAISVRMAGEALNGGRVGDLVRVRNGSSERVIEAKVVGEGRVRTAR